MGFAVVKRNRLPVSTKFPLLLQLKDSSGHISLQSSCHFFWASL